MRILAPATLIAFASLASAGHSYAGCRTTAALPGTIGPKATQQRSFTLSKPEAIVGLKTVKSSDALSFTMSRPSGADACDVHGPSNHEVCFVTVKSNGVHTIYVTNPTSRTVKYKIYCKNS